MNNCNCDSFVVFFFSKLGYVWNTMFKYSSQTAMISMELPINSMDILDKASNHGQFPLLNKLLKSL